MKAYPSPYDPQTGTMQHGMELRDYFAAMAMQGFAAHLGPAEVFETNAKLAYEWADAMLKAREI